MKRESGSSVEKKKLGMRKGNVMNDEGSVKMTGLILKQNK